MELDGAILKPPIDSSRSLLDCGYINSCPYDQFLIDQPTFSDANSTPFWKSATQTNGANDGLGTKAVLARLLKGKEREWASVIENKNGPLRLLDLPMDILKEIVKEVTHTNDLASLALTHSALHNLAIPHIYSRFDIVWPEAHSSAEPRTGVDALTYGLATLVMSDELFKNGGFHDKKRNQGFCQQCTCDQCQFVKSSATTALHPVKTLRRGNYFSQFTRKFSLGNGPPDWVSEYLITKEGGKMLGTLVALSIARMPNLETFIWDMPTGILRDVWISLASLGDRRHGAKPRLEKVWIRFHDNRDGLPDTQPSSGPQSTPGNLGVQPNTPSLHSAQELSRTPLPTLLERSIRRTEHPNFSILSPLRSLSVLDIDEPAYLGEISLLLEKSIERLRELRIGLALSVSDSGWASLASEAGQSSSPETSDEDDNTCGNVFSVIMKRVCDRRVETPLSTNSRSVDLLMKSSFATDNGLQMGDNANQLWQTTVFPQAAFPSYKATPTTATTGSSSTGLIDTPVPISESDLVKPLQPLLIQPPPPKSIFRDEEMYQQEQPLSEQSENNEEHTKPHDTLPHEVIKPQKLQLEVLEVERTLLNVKVLQESINWSTIQTLTLLQCGFHEQIWKALRRVYAPRSTAFKTSPSSSVPSKRLSSRPSLRLISPSIPQSSRLRRSSAMDLQSIPSLSYRLSLKRIHTDAVSNALISFLKDTLAPNSLEWMFLQDGREHNSPVTIDAIFRGPLRRHRSSLTKVMIDSAIGKPDSTTNAKRKKWMFNRELLAFITSGKMNCLKELAMAVDYKDWHFFVQRLPHIPHLRSLYVPYIADHVYGHQVNAKELALQLVDVVAIRPEIELCYMAFSTTCFELLENRHIDEPSWSRFDTSIAPVQAGPDVNDEHTDGEGYHDEADDQNNGADPTTSPNSDESDESGSDASESSADESDKEQSEIESQRPTLKLREILFYDDKVSIFKARHGRL